MRPSLLSSVGAIILAFAATGVASAVTLTESGDAGSLPPGAQAANGAVDLITGALSAPNDEDLYKICLTGGKTFSATTEGSQLTDPQLFLFDAAGRGVYGNDDFSSDFEGLQSTLPAGHPLTPSAGGIYYLGISSFANVPVSQGGQIFTYGPTSFPILEPIGPGGGSPVTGWSDNGLFPGAYRIALTGARPCLPTSKDQCKNGGWRNYGTTFKNQGQCVAFVQRGPRA
jgi:hypothetical protein